MLYLQAPILEPINDSITVSSLLQPYLTSLLALSPSPSVPLFTEFHFLFPPPPSPLATPENFLIVPPLLSEGTTASLTTALDESVVEAERLFWRIVGENARDEGVKFFPKEVLVMDDEDE